MGICSNSLGLNSGVCCGFFLQKKNKIKNKDTQHTINIIGLLDSILVRSSSMEGDQQTENLGVFYYFENYFLHFIGFTAVIGLLLLFHLRKKWLPKYRHWRASRHNQYLSMVAGLSFQDDVDSGLTSGTFDLMGNIDGGDSRKGLDEAAKKEIIAIMNKDSLTFDDARTKYFQNKMARNQIGPDGMPLDPRAFTFS